MSVQPRYSWEQYHEEVELDRQRQKQAIDNFYRVYGGRKPGMGGKTLLMAFLGVVVTAAFAYGFVYLVFSLPFGK